KEADLVVSVCEVEHSPLWANTLPSDCSMQDFIRDDIYNLPRQEIPIYYRLNGAFYLIKVKHLLDSTTLYNEKSYSFIMSKSSSIDIDELIDFQFAELLLENNIEE